jgi:NAD(P)H-hydrate epimerase
MENAGLAVSLHCKKLLKDKNAQIMFFAGRGNNAGDGFVAARHLINDGFKNVHLIVLKGNKEFSEQAGINFKILTKLTDNIMIIKEQLNLKKIEDKIGNLQLIVDALIGIGLKGEITGPLKEIIQFINNLNKKVISVDIPSGLNATSGKIAGVSVKAYKTVTFALPKVGCFKNDGPRICGKVKTETGTFPRKILN